MDRQSILKSTGGDVKRLPLDVREAFFLSQLDGQLSVEETAEIAGLELETALRLAERLITLGAVKRIEATRAPMSKPGGKLGAAVEHAARTGRIDPRAEEECSEHPSETRRRTIDARVDEEPGPPPSSKRTPVRLPTPTPKKRRSRKSIQAQKAVSPAVDEATLARITQLDGMLATLDHYALLEIERDADKKAIKRAYFRLASTFHPDRYFGKDLGTARAPLERIFKRVTEAHDTLSDAKRRPEYDARLPRAASAASPAPVSTPRPEPVPEPVPTSPPKSEPAPSVPPPPSSVTSAERAPASQDLEPPPSSANLARGMTATPERIRQLKAAAMEIKAQANIEILVKAAEDALRANDVVGAANNYRLALSHRDDPHLRMKFEEVDGRARIVRSEKNMTLAQAAEREQRWAEAAMFLERAHEARPDADVAARAATALRLSGGNLARAATLAEQAVALDAKNVAHRIALGEIYLAAKRMSAAEEACADAAQLAPKDARVKELAAAIAKKAKG